MVSLRRSSRHGRRSVRYVKKLKKTVTKHLNGRIDHYDRDMGGFNSWGKGNRHTQREIHQNADECSAVKRLEKKIKGFHNVGYGLTKFVVDDEQVDVKKTEESDEDEYSGSETDESDAEDAEDADGNWN